MCSEGCTCSPAAAHDASYELMLWDVQMWDLYSRDRIDTKADIWVSNHHCALTPCCCRLLSKFHIAVSRIVSGRVTLSTASLNTPSCSQRHASACSSQKCSSACLSPRLHAAGPGVPAVLHHVWQAGLWGRGQAADPQWRLCCTCNAPSTHADLAA